MENRPSENSLLLGGQTNKFRLKPQGTVQDGTSAVDISSATTKQIILQAPDGGLLTKDADFVTD